MCKPGLPARSMGIAGRHEPAYLFDRADLLEVSMRVVAAVAAFLLFSGIPAIAQYSPLPTTHLPASAGVACTEKIQPENGKHVEGSTESICETVFVPACPIDMRVHQRMGGSTVAVDANGIKRKVFAQRLRLFLNDLRRDSAGQKIVSATVTVHGTSTKERIQRLNSAPGTDFDSSSGSMAKTLNVDLAHWGEPGVSGDFLLPGFTSASRVDLESVTYEDGSVWKLSGNQTCRVAPDPVMLINH